MSDAEKLDCEAKTYVTKSTRDALVALAKERGEGSKVTQVLRDAIREYLANHKAKKK